MASFSVEAMVRGYHIYKDIWAAVVGEEFPCKREDGTVNFSYVNFRILRLHTKYMKICTIRKFPAIRYSYACASDMKTWCRVIISQ